MIDISGVDLVAFAKKVYELSLPRGLGFLHFTPQPLADEEAKKIVGLGDGRRIALDMDYVGGRGCKMTVFRDGDKLSIRDAWYDHTDDDLKQLLAEFNISAPGNEKHSLACECNDCQSKRANI